MTYETHDVLAGAYKGGRTSLKNLKTHVVEVDEQGHWVRVLCNRVQIENICDEVVHASATCATCHRRDPRRKSEP